MSTASRERIVGRCLVLRGDDVDTDRIIPARFLKAIVFDGLGEHVFADERAACRAAGTTHPFDEPRFQGASILLVGRNFGCGSSREHAPQALYRAGIQAVVGLSFAEIFFGNCTAIGVPCLCVTPEALARLWALCEAAPESPLTVDLNRNEVSTPSFTVEATMPAGPRHRLIAGAWDTTSELLAAGDAIRAVAARLPYVNGWR